jgi:hypothetical protein
MQRSKSPNGSFDSRDAVAIPQRHPLGCAVACVASRAGLEYLEALALFSEPENAWIRGYYGSEVVDALARAGLRYAFDELRSGADATNSARIERPGVIVFVAGTAFSYPMGHYLLRTRSGWMNPWANFPEMIPVRAAIQPALVGSVSHLIYELDSPVSA